MTRQNRRRLIAAAGFAALLLHGTPSFAASAPTAAAAPAEQRMDHISVVKLGAKGTPVILIPGLSSPRAVWDGVAPSLAKNHRVYVIQVNGFSGDAPGANLAPGILDGMVADLHGLIAREKITGAAVVGHSMGGLVAMMLAKAHPADAGKLMIVDSLPYIGDLFLPDATVAMIEPQAKMMRMGMQAAYGRPADPAVGQSVAARLALKPASRALVAEWAGKADGRVAGQAMYEDMTTDLRPDMAAINVPITLVYPGTADAQDRGTMMYHKAFKAAPHVTYVPIADAAHFVMLDQPAAFMTALDAFVGG